MEVVLATTFDEYVAWMAANSPHATVLDWWRRLDLALREYLAGSRVPTKARTAIEATIAADARLGSNVADQVRHMREMRNVVAHDPDVHISSEDAVHYASKALRLISVLTWATVRG